MKKQNAGLIALSIVFILMGGFSTIYNLSKYVSNRVFMSSAEKTTGYVKWIDHELKTWGHNKKASNKAETYYITVAFDVGGKEYTREIFTGTYYVSQNEKVNVYYNTDKNGEPDKVVTDIDNDAPARKSERSRRQGRRGRRGLQTGDGNKPVQRTGIPLFRATLYQPEKTDGSHRPV